MPRSRVVALVSDIHFDSQDGPTWSAFKAWVKDVRPERVVFLGDFLDFPSLSRHPMGPDDELFAVDQIKAFVREVQWLARYVPSIDVMEGNHDERWLKSLLGASPAFYRGILGVSLHDQCVLHGLPESVRWHREGRHTLGLRVGQFWLRHGHRQARGPGAAGKYIAAAKMALNGHRSEGFGHHHRAQLYCHTALGETAIVFSLPCMTGHHEYAGDANWQRGFGILDLSPDGTYATPYLVIMDRGRFSWGGRYYDGREKPKRKTAPPRPEKGSPGGSRGKGAPKAPTTKRGRRKAA